MNPNIHKLDHEGESFMLPGLSSNVENGLGYLVGIVSKTIPWMSCFAD